MLSLGLILSSCQKDDSSFSETERPYKKDFTPPEVSITSPKHGDAIWDTYLTIEISDNMGIRGLEIYQDGQLWRGTNLPQNGRPQTQWTVTIPYNIGLPDMRIIKAVAYDKAGLQSEHEITVYKLIACCGNSYSAD